MFDMRETASIDNNLDVERKVCVKDANISHFLPISALFLNVYRHPVRRQ